MHREVIALIKRRKSLKVVGAKGFEPSTSCSRTRNKNHLSRCPGVTYSFSGRSLLYKFGRVPLDLLECPLWLHSQPQTFYSLWGFAQAESAPFLAFRAIDGGGLLIHSDPFALITLHLFY